LAQLLFLDAIPVVLHDTQGSQLLVLNQSLLANESKEHVVRLGKLLNHSVRLLAHLLSLRPVARALAQVRRWPELQDAHIAVSDEQIGEPLALWDVEDGAERGSVVNIAKRVQRHCTSDFALAVEFSIGGLYALDFGDLTIGANFKRCQYMIKIEQQELIQVCDLLFINSWSAIKC